jgi:hypothetical protein
MVILLARKCRLKLANKGIKATKLKASGFVAFVASQTLYLPA